MRQAGNVEDIGLMVFENGDTVTLADVGPIRLRKSRLQVQR